MWHGRAVYNTGKSSVVFWAAIWCLLTALPVFFTCVDSAAESFLAATPPSEIRPNRNENLEPNRSAPAIGGTSIGTSGTTIGTQRPASPMKNTENIQNMEVDNRATVFGAKNLPRDQSPPTPAGAHEMSKSTAVREALSESTAPFDGAGNRGPETRPFGGYEPPAASSDRSAADPGYRRYMDMPDKVPGTPPTLR